MATNNSTKSEIVGATKVLATKLGVQPQDLLTAFSYETGGTFDPWQKGPTTQWGQHRGLIQWGEPQRKKYGVYEGMPVAEQVSAVGKYLIDAGVKPGMGLLDIYSAINAGRVGRYKASDANNGGAPGTVADKVSKQMEGHKAKANNMLGFTWATAEIATPSTSNSNYYAQVRAKNEVEDTRLGLGTTIANVVADKWTPDFESLSQRRSNNDIAWQQNFGKPQLDAAYAAGVPVEETDRLARTYNKDHFEHEVRSILTQQQLNKSLQGWGWTGKAVGVASEIFSPEMAAAIGVSLVTEGAAAPIVLAGRTGRIANIVRGATVSGIGNAAGDLVYMSAIDKPITGDDAWSALAIGAGVGAVVGGFRKAALAEEALTLQKSARAIQESLADDALEEMVEDAFIPSIRSGLEPLGSTKISGAQLNVGDNLPHVRNIDAPIGAFTEADPLMKGKTARYSVAGQLGGSYSAFTRSIYGGFVLDNVGHTGGNVLQVSAQERRQVLAATWSRSLGQTYKEAWQQYAVENKLGILDNFRRDDTFGSAISEYIRTTDVSKAARFPESVRKVGDAWRSLSGEILEHQQNPAKAFGGVARSIEGAEDIAKNAHYLPRVPRADKIEKIVERYGTEPTERYLSQAFLSNNPSMESKVADKLSKGWLHAIRTRAYGLEEPFSLFAACGNLQAMRRGLKELSEELTHIGGEAADAAFTTDEIEAVLAKMTSKEDKAGKVSHLKRRMTFDENFIAKLAPRFGGELEDLKFSDFLENDFEKLATNYIRQSSGTVALGGIKVTNPSNPSELLIDGITSKSDFDRLLNTVRKLAVSSGREKGLTDTTIKQQVLKDTENLTFLYKSIKSIPIEEGGSTAYRNTLKRLTDFQFIRVMNQAGFPSVPEIANVVGSVSVKAFFSQIPALGNYIKRIKSGQWGDELAREIEQFTGIGGSTNFGSQHMRFGEGASMPFEQSLTMTGRWGERLDKTLETGKQVTSWVGGLKPVTEYTQMAATKMIAQTFSDMALGVGKAFDPVLVKSMGLTNTALTNVLDRIKKYGTTTKGKLGNYKLTNLNLDKWVQNAGDLEARDALRMVLSRTGRRLIQENDPGVMAKWMSKPTAQMLLQFRSFMIGAYEKQLLHNLQVFRDGQHARAVTYFMASGVAASLGYMARTAIVGVGMPDRDAYYEKMFTPEKIAGAVVARSSWGSILPSALDSTVGTLMGSNMFDYRSTGLSSSFLDADAVPTFQWLNNLFRGIDTTRDSFSQGRQMSKREFRNNFSTLPFQNALPLAWLMAHMVEDRPNKEPRKQRK